MIASTSLTVQPDLQVLHVPFLERMEAMHPPDVWPRLLQSWTEPRVTAFRVNTLRAAADEVLAALDADGLAGHPVPGLPMARWVEAAQREALLASMPYQERQIYVQNLSSMVPPLVLGPQPGERVLDLAAAPGSKTLQLASMMQGNMMQGKGELVGELAAVEVVKARFFKLRANLAEQGAEGVRTFLRDGTTVWRHRPEYFDRILLDAPCSTEGRMHVDDPESYAYWSPRKIKEMARKQRRLLYGAVQALRPGGVLVYSTCSFAPEENEAVLAHVLKKFGDALEIEPITLDLPVLQPALPAWRAKTYPEAVSAARRIIPDTRWEAFFVAKIRKKSSTLRTSTLRT